MSVVEGLAAILLSYQLRFALDTAQIIFLSCSRRIGKTFFVAFKAVSRCIEKPNHRVWYSGADEEGGEEFIDACKYWLSFFNAAATEINYEEGDDSEVEFADKEKDVLNQTIRFSNGSRITVLSSNPKRFRGKGGDIILDEFAHHERARAMWKAAVPAAMVWGYNLYVISTHNGELTLFNAFIQRIKSGKSKFKASLHEITIQQAVDEGLLDKIKNRETSTEERQEWIQSLIDSCETLDDAMEEYFCKPKSTKGAYLPLDMILANERDNILLDVSLIPGPLFLGYDFARKKDLSVIYVLQEISGHLIVRHIEVMQYVKYKDQKEILYCFLRLPTVIRVCMDATPGSNGHNLSEDALDEFGEFKVDCVTFSQTSKALMAGGLQKELTSNTLSIPKDETQRKSLNAVKKLPTANGFRFDVDGSKEEDDSNSDAKDSDAEIYIGHADHFWALALAVKAAREAPGGIPFIETKGKSREQRKMLRDQRDGKDPLDFNRFYQNFKTPY